MLLTASTSEGYALLLKLLCDPGDEVLVPAPAYPLLDLLADLEAVRLVRYPLRHDGAWHLDLAAPRGGDHPAGPGRGGGVALQPDRLAPRVGGARRARGALRRASGSR